MYMCTFTYDSIAAAAAGVSLQPRSRQQIKSVVMTVCRGLRHKDNQELQELLELLELPETHTFARPFLLHAFHPHQNTNVVYERCKLQKKRSHLRHLCMRFEPFETRTYIHIPTHTHTHPYPHIHTHIHKHTRTGVDPASAFLHKIIKDIISHCVEHAAGE